MVLVRVICPHVRRFFNSNVGYLEGNIVTSCGNGRTVLFRDYRFTSTNKLISRWL